MSSGELRREETEQPVLAQRASSSSIEEHHDEKKALEEGHVDVDSVNEVLIDDHDV